MAPRPKPPNAIDPGNQYRAEIEQRTACGESCEHIADALRAKGVDISKKTISRRRIEWGLRKGSRATTDSGRTNSDRLAQPKTKQRGARAAATLARKHEIEARTARGETAEQIAHALTAQGVEMKRGESSVLRLQSTWGLISPDEARMRGKKRKRSDGKQRQPAAPKLSKREMQKEANARQRNQTLHYPTDCSFGPKKRVDDTADFDNDELYNASESPRQPDLPVQTFSNSPPTNRPSLSSAAEVMSVEFLVDLATSTLSAATNLKAMLLAHQAGIPVDDSQSPPTPEELSTARRKVREAASVMHDLAVDPVADDALS